MLRSVVTEFNKQMHVRPVMFVSAITTFIGTGVAMARAFTGPEFTTRSYVDQNEVNMRSLVERELNAELFLLLTTPIAGIPVPKRHVWQMSGEAQEVFEKIQALPVPETKAEIDQFNGLYKQWLSQAYDILWSLKEQRGYISHESRVYKQQRQYALNNLPPAKPWTVRSIPDTSRKFINENIQPPSPDAPREEFVKYYAEKYDFGL